MKTLLLILFCLFCLQSCTEDCGCVKPPPTPGAIVFGIFYRTPQNIDLLDPSLPNSYKEKDIFVTRKIEIDGIIKELDDEPPIRFEVGDATHNYMYYFQIYIPTTSDKNKNPIATYVKLSEQDTDTITYSFIKPPSKSAYLPQFIYYNKKLVWEHSKAKQDEPWNMTIEKVK